MPKLLQINTTANWGSTGKIAEDIAKLAINKGFESWMAYGRGNPKSVSNLIRIGNDFDMKLHGIQTRILDNHGLASKKVTKDFLEKIGKINPDIIHLHNIHGYYINYPLLFDFLKKWGGPVVWTLHDCWPFTGHCAYYTFKECYNWKTQCQNCPQLNTYPISLWKDRSYNNYNDKKEAFSGLKNLTLIPVSNWLAKQIKESFLKDYPIKVIHNGIDLEIFKPSENKNYDQGKFSILGVASVWDYRKGLEEFIRLRNLLPDNYKITLAGLSKKQIDSLPQGIEGISRTENVGQLVKLYRDSDVYVNPTLEDNFPTTNLEALACGTPVLTYNTGGSPEAIDDKTGIIVDYKNIQQLSEKIRYVCENKSFNAIECRQRAINLFDKDKNFKKYIDLYQSLLEI